MDTISIICNQAQRVQKRDGEMRKLALGTMATVAALTIAGCSSTVTDQESAVSEDPSVVTETSTATPEETEVTAEPTDEASQVEAEDSVEAASMTDVEIVLAALMGPEGEYAAAASYLAVLDEYGQVEPYATIYEAELRHADALIRQLERLGVEVPENPYLGEIAAPADLQTAAEAWAEGEVLNVELYDYLLGMTDDAQLTKVLENLRAASLDSHLPAFEAAAENGGTLDDASGFGHSAQGKGHGRNA